MIVDQLFTPKPLKEGGPYDLPGKDYDRPGDTPRKAPASDEHNPYPFSPEEDDDYFRELFRKKREAAKQQGVAEDSWNPVDHGDFPVNYDADTAQDAVGVGDASKWKAMTQYYSHHINVTRALDDLYRAIGRSYYDQGGRPVRFAAKMSHGYKDGSTETKYFDTKEAVYSYAQTYGRTVLSIEKVDTSDDDSGLIKLPVLLGVGTHKKKWILPFPDENYAQKWQFKHKNIADIQWPAGHALAESTGQDSKSWMASIQQQYPNVQFVQAKMMGAPIMALVNGKPVAQFDTKKGVAEGKRNKQRRLNEALLMEDPVYRRFKRVGRYIAEQKLTEPEILQIFSDAEAGMTDRATGANRTFAGRGKDATVDFAKDVAGAVKGVLNSIQNSTPVAAVDTAYDQATDALANLTGGQKGAVMTAINKYRNLAKQYPKTAGFTKAALVAIAGLATGGAGLPAIAGLTYALDSAIKGDKLSSVIGKGAGAAALAAAGQGIFGGATQTGPADTNAFTNVNQMGDHTGEYVSMPDGSDIVSPLVAPPPELATYTVQLGDTLSQIAERFNTTVQELVGLNPQLAQASGATAGQGLNPDVIFPGQQITLPPGTPGADVYAGAVGTNANTMSDIARGQVPNSAITQGMAARNAVKESIKYRARILPANKLIDQKATVLNWALCESVGRPTKSVNLTTLGTYTVFENIDRYRLALLEATQPGRPELPDQYAPAMSGGAGVPSKPGLIGRGLNYLDKKAKAVGGALSNFGHQFTTNVTKEKLKMNWHQAGKPSDSDQLAAWLVGQGVPQTVVTSVFGKMGIPYTAPTTAEPAKAASSATSAPTAAGGAQRTAYTGSINPATGRLYTGDELRAKFYPDTSTATSAPADTTAQATPLATATTSSVGKFPGEDPTGPGYVGRREAARRQAARATAAGKPTAPNFAQQNAGYKSVNYAPNIKTGINLPKPTAPATSTAPADTVGTYNKKTGAATLGGKPMIAAKDLPPNIQKQLSGIKEALVQPVAELLQMVETKEDVQRIKKFVDDTFVRYGAVTESAFAVRNQILEHVTQAGAQRRREHSRKAAH